VDGLVVDKDMNWAFRRGDKVDEGQSLSPLGGLREAVYFGAVVEAVASVIEDPETRPGKEGVRLVSTCAVRGGVDPAGPIRVKVGVPFVVASVRRWARDRLRHGVVGEVRLKVEEIGVFLKEAAVPGVRWEGVPLGSGDEDFERTPLRRPTRAIPHDVLLGLFRFVAIAANGRVVGGAFSAVEALLGVVTPGEVIYEEP